MRDNSSSGESQNSNVENMKELKEPHLSNAYIRTLVKQLSSSRTQDSSNAKEHQDTETTICDDIKQEKSNQPVKKQVRRRLQTSRPYKERLLNMAEARKEIVAALKFHRANMKRASEKQQKLESGPGIQTLESSTYDQICLEHEGELKSGSWNSRIHASNLLKPNLSHNYAPNSSYSTGLCCSYNFLPFSPIVEENLDLVLPRQTLGLNLNLQDFNIIDTSPFRYTANSSSIYSTSSYSSSSSPVTDETACVVAPPSDFHQLMYDEEIAEIRPTEQQHQMEGQNIVDSTWWFQLLKNKEIENDQDHKDEGSVASPFDDVMEVPAWLSANDSCLQSLDDEYLQDPALPCMEIEEIEGMDVDWLA